MIQKLSTATIHKFKYDTKEERVKHVKEMEQLGFECTGQIKQIAPFGTEQYWYGEFIQHSNADVPESNLTPYEEVYQVLEALKKLKEVTLDGTDIEYFSKEQLRSLVEISEELISASEKIVAAKENE